MPSPATTPVAAFRRRIQLALRAESNANACIRVALEDDFHHFRLELALQGLHIRALRTQSLRHPYSLCPAADAPLQALVGAGIDPARLPTRALEASHQCTHLLDLAGLACSFATGDSPSRRYDIEVPDRDAQGCTTVRLWRDGALVLTWSLRQMRIEAPPPYAGVDLLQAMGRWASQHLDAQTCEEALVLRRGSVISRGRGKALDVQVHAEASGRCFAQQPARAQQALRMRGSTWEFSHRPAELCADDAAWLAFDTPPPLD